MSTWDSNTYPDRPLDPPYEEEIPAQYVTMAMAELLETLCEDQASEGGETAVQTRERLTVEIERGYHAERVLARATEMIEQDAERDCEARIERCQEMARSGWE